MESDATILDYAKIRKKRWDRWWIVLAGVLFVVGFLDCFVSLEEVVVLVLRAIRLHSSATQVQLPTF